MHKLLNFAEVSQLFWPINIRNHFLLLHLLGEYILKVVSL